MQVGWLSQRAPPLFSYDQSLASHTRVFPGHSLPSCEVKKPLGNGKSSVLLPSVNP